MFYDAEGDVLLGQIVVGGEVVLLCAVVAQDADGRVVDGGVEKGLPARRVGERVTLLVGTEDAVLHAVFGKKGIFGVRMRVAYDKREVYASL